MGKDAYHEIYSNLFNQQHKKPMKTILYFTAPAWCSPCRTLGPIIDKVSSTISTNKIDVDSNREAVMQYNIKSVPTVVLLEDGKEVRRFIGIRSEAEILNFIK